MPDHPHLGKQNRKFGLGVAFGFLQQVDHFHQKRFIGFQDQANDIQIEFDQSFDLGGIQQFMKKYPEFLHHDFRNIDRTAQQHLVDQVLNQFFGCFLIGDQIVLAQVVCQLTAMMNQRVLVKLLKNIIQDAGQMFLGDVFITGQKTGQGKKGTGQEIGLLGKCPGIGNDFYGFFL